MLLDVGRPVGQLRKLCSDENCDVAEMIEPTVRMIFLILLLFQVSIEVYQVWQDGSILEYLSSYSNRIDAVSYLTNFTVIAMAWMNFDR